MTTERKLSEFGSSILGYRKEVSMGSRQQLKESLRYSTEDGQMREYSTFKKRQVN